MHRILLSLFLLPLFLLYAGSAFADDERTDSASLIGKVAEVLDATDGFGQSVESDDGAVFTAYPSRQLPSLKVVLRRSSAPDVPSLNPYDSTLIRAPPACFS
ncbi:hypothetical protein BGP77_04115 [Saccharospirillum sp. MSK14-1]|uniref:hypothetical protein n=1 Tax=Saccharospirillum sp. MSK14-1 TaxID=1897632 RepID=UPI000D340207|nr:hypothetical protein [Saccharospirillum sp. MSK14-1]PTY36491.1 hypothetical protein BGP77_04115 [Saccharospirillum sp. MSK14-1]